MLLIDDLTSEKPTLQIWIRISKDMIKNLRRKY